MLNFFFVTFSAIEDLHRIEIEEPAPKRRRKRTKDPEDSYAIPKSPNVIFCTTIIY